MAYNIRIERKFFKKFLLRSQGLKKEYLQTS